MTNVSNISNELENTSCETCSSGKGCVWPHRQASICTHRSHRRCCWQGFKILGIRHQDKRTNTDQQISDVIKAVHGDLIKKRNREKNIAGLKPSSTFAGASAHRTWAYPNLYPADVWYHLRSRPWGNRSIRTAIILSSLFSPARRVRTGYCRMLSFSANPVRTTWKPRYTSIVTSRRPRQRPSSKFESIVERKPKHLPKITLPSVLYPWMLLRQMVVLILLIFFVHRPSPSLHRIPSQSFHPSTSIHPPYLHQFLTPSTLPHYSPIQTPRDVPDPVFHRIHPDIKFHRIPDNTGYLFVPDTG